MPPDAVGSGEPGKPWMLSDLADLPELTMALYGGPGRTHINMPACRGEVSYKGQALVAQDIEHLRDALAKAPRRRASGCGSARRGHELESMNRLHKPARLGHWLRRIVYGSETRFRTVNCAPVRGWSLRRKRSSQNHAGRPW